MALCDQCGKPISEGDRFCHSCGSSTAGVGPAAGASAPQPGGPPPAPPTAHPTPPPAPPPAHPAPPPMAPPPQYQPARELSLEEKAERRVKQRIALLHHIGIYVIVNAFLVIVWALTYTGYPWFLWPMAAWGVGLAFHIITYLLSSKDDSARHRMVEREVEKIKREQVPPPEQ